MNWQNLPPALLYPMLIPHVFKLCIKYKTTIAIIAKSNPAFPFGGLPFASKKIMFDLFKDKKEFLTYTLIKENESLVNKIKIAEDFVADVNYPIIAKPDSSHRGIDINLVSNRKELLSLLNNQKWDYILQEFCDYDYEFGIFYCRIPGQNKGNIISLSGKAIPVIIGNGIDDLRTLISKSNIDNSQPILERYSTELNIVIPEGKIIKTLVCASHAQGAVFTDAKEYLTDGLISKTDEICNISGFNFGRLDVKAKSHEELKKGNYKIIEINGATSEFIHIYDKKYSFKNGISDLKRQWDLLFEISHKNRNIPENNLSVLKFIHEYINFFLLTKRVTGKLW